MPSPTPLTVNCCRNLLEHVVSPQNADMRFPGSLSPPDRKRAAWLDPSHRGGRCLQTQPQPACISPPASVSNPSPRSSTPLRAPVAQLDRALPSEGRGREFESRRVRQYYQRPGRPFLDSIPVMATIWQPGCNKFLARVMAIREARLTGARGAPPLRRARRQTRISTSW
jgi:hypothetical protein